MKRVLILSLVILSLLAAPLMADEGDAIHFNCNMHPTEISAVKDFAKKIADSKSTVNHCCHDHLSSANFNLTGTVIAPVDSKTVYLLLEDNPPASHTIGPLLKPPSFA
ncbi:MAG: hypothetical protein WAO98_09060 [Alphaproteobacteria bacterium]